MSDTPFHVADLFELVAASVPERDAVVGGDGRLSYRQLGERADALAGHLHAAGVRPGDHVAVFLRDTVEHVEALFALFKLRAVPINVNHRYVGRELAYLLRDADAAGLIFDAAFDGTVAAAASELLAGATRLRVGGARGDAGGPVAGAVDYEQAVERAPRRPEGQARSGDDWYIIYTGGTTGMPKGVMWRHEDLILGGLLADRAGRVTRPVDVVEGLAETAARPVLPLAPLMHATGQWLTTSALISGGTVVLPPPRFDGHAAWELMARERVATVAFVGDAMGRPLADAVEAATQRLDLTSLRYAVSSGAMLSPAVKEALRRHLPGAVIVDTIAASESGRQARAFSTGSPNDDVGTRFHADENAAVLGEDLSPVPPGSGRIGRLARRGHVASGYYKDPERSARTFPVIDGTRWCVSGDHATVEADGTIVFLGRGGACINTGGEKVYPDEVDRCLRAHSDVFDTLTVGVPDTHWGERVVAIVQPRCGRSPSSAALESHARTLLAGYKVPKDFYFVERLERAPSGKPDYAWARSLVSALSAANEPKGG